MRDLLSLEGNRFYFINRKEDGMLIFGSIIREIEEKYKVVR